MLMSFLISADLSQMILLFSKRQKLANQFKEYEEPEFR